MTEARPYGAWASPLTAADAAAAAIGLAYVTAHDGRLYWIESRPNERGRSVLMSAAPDSAGVELTPPPINVRSRVHEYGGRPYAVAGSAVAYCEFGDQRLRVHAGGQTSGPVTPDGFRYADGAASADGRTIYWVREDIRGPANR